MFASNAAASANTAKGFSISTQKVVLTNPDSCRESAWKIEAIRLGNAVVDGMVSGALGAVIDTGFKGLGCVVGKLGKPGRFVRARVPSEVRFAAAAIAGQRSAQLVMPRKARPSVEKESAFCAVTRSFVTGFTQYGFERVFGYIGTALFKAKA